MMHTVQKSRRVRQLRRACELEKRLAARLMASDSRQWAALYTKVYDEYMHTVGGGLYRPFNWLQPSEGL